MLKQLKSDLTKTSHMTAHQFSKCFTIISYTLYSEIINGKRVRVPIRIFTSPSKAKRNAHSQANQKFKTGFDKLVLDRDQLSISFIPSDIVLYRV